MKLVSINIEVNKHYNTVPAFLKKEDPDVVCLQEFLEEDFDRFKKELNMQGVFKAFKYVESSNYSDIRGKKFGVAIFAKNIADWGYIFYTGNEENLSKTFEEYSMDKNYALGNVLLWADIPDESGQLFKFITIHPPVTKEGEASPYQLQVFDALLEALGPIPEFVICGDTNAPRGKEAFRRMENRYKDNIPLHYLTSIDQNLHRVKGIQFMVDGLFTTPAYTATNVRLEDGVSDHMAIVADIEKISYN